MRVCTPKSRRLDLRPETCPPGNRPHSGTLGSAGIRGLFLGLFGVTRSGAVAACSAVGRFGTVCHCFGTVWPLY